MSDNTDSHEDGNVHYEGGIPIFSPEPKNEDAEKRADKSAQRTYEDRQITLQRQILYTQIGIVLFGLIGSGISYWQAKTAQKSAETAEKAVLLAQKTYEDNHIFGENEIKLSSAAFQANIDNFHEDQRAWVGSTSTYLYGDMVPPNPIQARVEFTNTGKTIAKNFDIRTTLHASDIPLNIAEYAKHPIPIERGFAKIRGVPKSVSVLFPNNKFIAFGFTGSTDAAGIESVKEGKKLLYFFGEITYFDVFNKKHFTHFCSVYVASIKAFAPCDSYNDAD